MADVLTDIKEEMISHELLDETGAFAMLGAVNADASSQQVWVHEVKTTNWSNGKIFRHHNIFQNY